MSEVDSLLRASAIELTAVAPQDAGAQWCLGRYFDELGSRFPGGYDRGVDSATDLDDFSPPKGCFFLAGLFGEPVGCGGIRTFAPGPMPKLRSG